MKQLYKLGVALVLLLSMILISGSTDDEDEMPPLQHISSDSDDGSNKEVSIEESPTSTLASLEMPMLSSNVKRRCFQWWMLTEQLNFSSKVSKMVLRYLLKPEILVSSYANRRCFQWWMLTQQFHVSPKVGRMILAYLRLTFKPVSTSLRPHPGLRCNAQVWISPDGNFFLSQTQTISCFSGRHYRRVGCPYFLVSDVATGKCLQTFYNSDYPITACDFATTNAFVITASYNVVHLWDIRSGTVRAELECCDFETDDVTTCGIFAQNTAS